MRGTIRRARFRRLLRRQSRFYLCKGSDDDKDEREEREHDAERICEVNPKGDTKE